VAIDDVQETGGGADHLWFVRSIRVDVISRSLEDREIALTMVQRRRRQQPAALVGPG
jgi:hypothetical protein